MKPSLLCLVVIALLVPRPTAMPRYADWSMPINLGSIVNSSAEDREPAISKDGLSLYFTSTRAGGFGAEDIWVSRRKNRDGPWGVPVNLGPNINTASNDRVPAFSRDGHWMFFATDRPGGFGALDIWASFRAHTHDDFGWELPQNAGPGVNSGSDDAGPSYFENDDFQMPQLFFTSNRAGGVGAFDIYVSDLAADGSFDAAAIVRELSTPQGDARPSVRHDGLEVFLLSNRLGSSGVDLWAATRESTLDAWSRPVNLGSIVNTAFIDSAPYISSDRETLFFFSNRPGGVGLTDLYVTTRTK